MDQLQQHIRKQARKHNLDEQDLYHAERCIYYLQQGIYRESTEHQEQIKNRTDELYLVAEKCVKFGKRLEKRRNQNENNQNLRTM